MGYPGGMLFLLPCLAFAGAPDDPFDVDPFDVDARVETLPNGLRVVAAPLHRTDKVAVHLHVGVGSRDEAEGELGLAHLFEHLMFEGSEHVPGNSYDAWLTAAGGDNNAFTTADETAYHASAPSGALDLMLFLESDRMAWLRPALTEASLANQVDVVLRERAQDHAAPHGRDHDALATLMYPPGHPYHVPAIGTVEDLEGLTLQRVRDFHRGFYDPRTAVLGIVGNIDPDEAIARARHWFADVPPAAEPRLGAAARELPRLAAPRSAYIEDHVDTWTVYRAYPAVPIGHADEAALVIASFILSDGRGTRLDRLGFRREDVVDTDARARLMELDGMFLAAASTTKPRVAWMQKKVDRALQSLVDRPPTAQELERARRRVRRLLLDSLERPADRAEVLVDCLRLTGSADCTREDAARVEAVTARDVSEAMRRLLEGPALTLYVVPMGEASTVPEGVDAVVLP